MVDRAALATACRQLFDPALLGRALESTGWTQRKRVLTAEVMLLAIVHLVVAPCESLLMLMDRLRHGEVLGDRRIQFSSAAFYMRMRAVPHELFLSVFREVTQRLNARGGRQRKSVRSWAPFANGIYAVDDTTLDALMRRTKSLASHSLGATETLAGRLGCAIDLTTQRFVEVLYDDDAAANEKSHFWPLVSRLGAGNLLVFDLGYFSFPLLDGLTERWTWFVCRMRNKTTYKVLQVGIDTPRYRESLIQLGKYRSDRAAYPLRLVEMRVGDTWHQYLTNMLDPQQLRADAVWRLYQERWTIEKAFAVLKRALGAAHLHTCHTNGTLIQIWATLAVYQVLQDLRMDVAHAYKVDVEDISWVNLTRRVAWYVERPRNNQTLRQWLTDPGNDLMMNKRGVRERKTTTLTDTLMREIRAFRPTWEPPPPGKPRQGKPEPRKKESLVIVAKLAP